ncbi:MAG: 50S ribosomal protein L16 [Rickettsia sp.]|nr:50S ribosomal protein L16 [Rickettsia sp.]
MLIPAKSKFRKAHKGRISTISKSGYSLSFGNFGLKALGQARVTSKQIESARKAAIRKMKRQGKFWIKIFPNLPVSQKPNEVRMGKGKGNIEYYAFRVAPGRIIFEVDGVIDKIAIEALELAKSKLGVKTKIIKRYA